MVFVKELPYVARNVKIAYLQVKYQFIILLSEEKLVPLHPQIEICCIR